MHVTGLLATNVVPPAVSVAHTPAFYADLTHDITSFGTNQAVVFDHARLNVNNVYNHLHGMFTAPTPGVYVFSWTTLVEYQSVGSMLYQHTELVVNGQFYARQFSDGRSGIISPASVTVTVSLQQGDEVWIRFAADTEAGLHGNYHCSFTGWLLQ
jgi:hypothetical protein